MTEKKDSITSWNSDHGGKDGGVGETPGGGGRKTGLGVGMTAFFLIAQMAGAGFLALPRALADVGWLSVPMMIIFCVSVAFAGTRLGKSYVLLEERWPEEYKHGSRQPYMEIADKALGPVGRKVALWSVVLNLFGSTVVFIILISDMVYKMIWVAMDEEYVWHHQVSPYTHRGSLHHTLTWLGSPKDFWQASVLAVVSTAIAVIVIIVEIFSKPEQLPDNPPYPNPTVYSFSLGFGAILFAFGGASVFPTIQNDMADRTQFWKSVIAGFCGILSMYLPVGVVGYAMFGDTVQSNILLTVEMTVPVMVAVGLEIVNLLCTFMISINPVVQTVEEYLGVPSHFCWQRVVTRTLLVMLQMLIGTAIPSFGKILNLIGGSLITMCTFILPPLMYMKLIDDRSDPKWPVKTIPLWKRIYLVEIMIVGIVGGVCSTLTAAYDVILASFNDSCFTHFYNCPNPV